MHKSRLFLTFLLLSLLFAVLAYGVSSHIVLEGIDNIELRQAIKSMDHMHERLVLSESNLSWQARSIACSDVLHTRLKAMLTMRPSFRKNLRLNFSTVCM